MYSTIPISFQVVLGVSSALGSPGARPASGYSVPAFCSERR